MPTRREFLAGSVPLYLEARYGSRTTVVNDVHSQLNRTNVDRVVRPTTLAEIQSTIRAARSAHQALSIAGGRHAMGGQQFGKGTVLVDMRALTRLLNFDRDAGTLEVEAGVFWPELISAYVQAQRDNKRQWGIAQKQTGADRLTIGGTLAANAHGRGLTMKPFISDIESFNLVDADGNVLTCNRKENSELFRLAVGGYGLFGIVSSVTLRLVPRQKIRRVVEVRDVNGLMGAFDNRIRNGFLYGDFQFSVDKKSDDFLHKGVFSCYQPVDPDTLVPEKERQLSDENLRTLLYLAHTDQDQAFKRYADYYLSTDGQIYWSDTHQLSIYPENYHLAIDRSLHTKPSTEIITEIDVPREELEAFLAEVREDFRKNNVELIYGTIRLIQKDDENFLPWAKQPYACTIFNLHTEHTPEGLRHSADAFRRLIGMAVRRNGNYYLTYHRDATPEQILACYPNFPEFLRLKRKHDPDELFQSDWYRFYKGMFAKDL
jgi:FAD/FMN-containing dehydrogenase